MESALADPLDERATVVNLLLYHVREESQRNPEASGLVCGDARADAAEQTSNGTAVLEGGERPELGEEDDLRAGAAMTSAGPPDLGPGCSILDHPELVWCEDTWDDSREVEAVEAVARQGPVMEKRLADRYEARAGSFWNLFYRHNSTNFYKDRHYLQVAFPDVIAPAADEEEDEEGGRTGPPTVTPLNHQEGSQPSSAAVPEGKQGRKRPRACVMGSHCCDVEGEGAVTCPAPGEKVLVEVGCGVGNAVFPLLQDSPGLFVWALDFAKRAIELARQHPAYHETRRCRALVCDVVKDDLPATILAHGGADLCLCMFSLSAMAPHTMPSVADKLCRVLKPGGRVLLRDYGRYDQAQLRFKRGHRLGENFYLRSDGTRAYYFTTDELRDLFTGAGLEVVELEYIRRQYANREQRTARRRVWVHGIFQKPAAT